ncbi:MAG: hypothetical protein U5K69_26835 [Balneolaceae bacterium]|nr:hypothetical protein [Balneolaceae bacterium]
MNSIESWQYIFDITDNRDFNRDIFADIGGIDVDMDFLEWGEKPSRRPGNTVIKAGTDG